MVFVRTCRRASGSLATLVSRTILPVSSTMQTLVSLNIDSRRASNEQHRFKNPFARIRLFQLLIPQLHFGYFFNSIGQPRPKHLGRWANHVRNALRAYTISDAAPGDGRNTNELRCSPSRQPRAHRVNRVNLLLDRLRLAAPRAAAPRIAFHCREGPANPAGTKQ